MKRFFYTDPIAAAWMAKHHGITFGHGDSLRSACEAVDHDGSDYPGAPFIIHPGSLRLLEPKHGDLCEWGGQHHAYCLKPSEQRELIVGKPNDYVLLDNFYWLLSDTKVVQRNGKAFIWPESDEA